MLPVLVLTVLDIIAVTLTQVECSISLQQPPQLFQNGCRSLLQNALGDEEILPIGSRRV